MIYNNHNLGPLKSIKIIEELKYRKFKLENGKTWIIYDNGYCEELNDYVTIRKKELRKKIINGEKIPVYSKDYYVFYFEAD